MIFLIQPKVQYAILFRLIFFFIRGVTSQLTINLDEYDPIKPNPVDVGQDVIFTGSVQYSSPPYGVFCKVNIPGSSSADMELCYLDVDDCNGPDDITCDCVNQVGDTYNFVITDKAKEERSEALLYCEVSGIQSQRRTYPVIQKPSTTVNTSCIAEEGNSHSLECALNGNARNFGWEIYLHNTGKEIQTCTTKHCVCENALNITGGYKATLSCGNHILTSKLTIDSVSRNSTQNDGVTWKCYADNTRIEVCDLLVIYAKPEKPTCSKHELQPGDTQLSITCVTNQVYPKAECQLYNKNDTLSHALVASSITYNHSTTKTDPDYYKTTCTINIDVSILGVGQHQLFVKMFPNVRDGLNRAGTNSDIMSVILSYPQVELSSNCFNGPNVKGNFIKIGTISSCTCAMTNTGNPPGQIQWYRYSQGQSTPIGSLVSDGSVTFNITEENTSAGQVYYCQVTSALIGKNQTENFTREFAHGPDSVNLTGQNQFNLCPGEDENITVVCRVPEKTVNPKTKFRIFSESRKKKIYGNGTEKEDSLSYTYSFKPTEGGLYNLICKAENSEFRDLTKNASHKIIVQAPPKAAPIIKIKYQEREMKNTGSIVKITEGESVTVTCHVDGGYPPANVTLNCSSFNKSSVADTSASLTFVNYTREMDNQTCICTATHVSGCYQHNQTSVWLSVSLAEPLSDENTGLDAAAVGGGIGAAVIVIVLVILVICVLKRKGLMWNKIKDKKKQNEFVLHQAPNENREGTGGPHSHLYINQLPNQDSPDDGYEVPVLPTFKKTETGLAPNGKESTDYINVVPPTSGVFVDTLLAPKGEDTTDYVNSRPQDDRDEIPSTTNKTSSDERNLAIVYENSL